jgi:hypothetical protein
MADEHPRDGSNGKNGHNGHNGHGKRDLADGLRLGTVTAIAVTGARAAAGKMETGDVWAPINDVSHTLLGDERSHVTGFDPLPTLLGLALNVAAMEACGVLYRRLFGKPKFPQSALTALGAASAVYVIERYAAPKRLAPGYERSFSPKGLGLVFGAMALAFLLANPDENS